MAYGNTTLQGILDKGIYASGQDVDGIIATSIQADASNPWAVLSRIPTSMLTGVLAVMTAMVILLVYLLISLRRRQKERPAIMDQMARSQEEAIRAEEMTRTAEERSQFFNISHDMRTPQRHHRLLLPGIPGGGHAGAQGLPGQDPVLGEPAGGADR